VEVLPGLPALGPVFVRALLPRPSLNLGRRSLSLSKGRPEPATPESVERSLSLSKGRREPGPSIPGRTVLLPGLRQDAARYAAYSRTCGFTLRDHVPPTWLFVLSFPLQVHLLADPAASLKLVGMVHVANRMVLHRPVGLTEPLDLAVRAGGLRAHRRGALVDVVSRAEADGEVVWDAVSTYLSSGVTLPGAPGLPGLGEPDREPFEPVLPQSLWRLPADLGRRYRAVAGDPNPIHTSRLVARAFGFARPIIHGMWTHARALAALENRLPPAYAVDVRFARPILLPGTVGFHVAPAPDGLSTAVTTRDGTRPHLLLRTSAAPSGR
jgi:acyl dehydratase